MISTEELKQEGTNYANFIFFATLLAYHFIRVFENCSCTSESLGKLLKQPIGVTFVSIIGLLGSAYFGFKIGFTHLYILIIPSFITLWYAVPFFKYKGKSISLRNYPRVKLISVALVWAVNTVLFPLQDDLSNSLVWIIFIQRVFIIMALIIPFDIRDMKEDPKHLKTLPQLIGITNSKRVGALFLFVFIALSFAKGASLDTLIIELLVFLISLFLLYKMNKETSKYYTSFWVEAVPIVWWLFWMLVSNFL